MNTKQLEYFLRHNRYTKPFFLGVFPADLLPKTPIRKKQTKILIANFDTSDKRGSHWVAFRISPATIELFDTSGEFSFRQNRYFQRFVHNNMRKKFLLSKHVIQGQKSDLCGEYCLLFLLARCRRISYKKFINTFCTKHQIINDKKAIYFFGKKYVLSKT